ncbi:hypothetical protein SKAU_G00321640 [Synaphobranchus kaupii]|uniref:SMB domain-containing protein n=1 Tax=Synaphobranchus kaupii TaxID=118154 RepID=A0A9Q1ENS2_SYNKA|nr:hypothetical protein SKAU_G00321640 [Synaphobranchus kaupii]
MHLRAILLLACVATALAAEESCAGRCDAGFDSKKKCQCDSKCGFYRSCCVDYETTCSHKITRGDTFHDPDYDTEVQDSVTTMPSTVPPETTMRTTAGPKTTTFVPKASTIAATTQGPTTPIDPEADTCSGRTFDSFMQVKNGSIYAFRGEYFFELDEKSVLPGYPKLIKDVWGISGPIDAAFTRINCQGKTYIFKGNKYWRFEDGILDDDYPRDISVGFQKIPDDVDAAFAIPSGNHRDKEKVYFFKGDQYYQYEFKHQPSHEECAQMSKASPSVLFNHYTDLYCDQWTDLFDLLFQGVQGDHSGPRFIRKDWVGIRPPVDAVMAGRLYITPKIPPTPTPTPRYVPGPGRAYKKRRGQKSRRRPWWRRQKRASSWGLLDLFDDDFDSVEITMVEEEPKANQPVQNVYFFKKDKYYRVDLKTKIVDYANPPYPRPIAKYWLGCKEDTSWAEK